ncbi:hypothetical protein MTO96_043687, partial [Rhipicephalus appendiculatus]
MPPTITAERETGAAEEIVKNSPPEATFRENEEVNSLANPNTPCLPASLTGKEYAMDDVASTLGLTQCAIQQSRSSVETTSTLQPYRYLNRRKAASSLGVDSSIELSPSLDECDVEMLAPREVKRAHTAGTSSDGSQDSRSESQQPKKPRPSSRGPKCVVGRVHCMSPGHRGAELMYTT